MNIHQNNTFKNITCVFHIWLLRRTQSFLLRCEFLSTLSTFWKISQFSENMNSQFGSQEISLFVRSRRYLKVKSCVVKYSYLKVFLNSCRNIFYVGISGLKSLWGAKKSAELWFKKGLYVVQNALISCPEIKVTCDSNLSWKYFWKCVKRQTRVHSWCRDPILQSVSQGTTKNRILKGNLTTPFPFLRVCVCVCVRVRVKWSQGSCCFRGFLRVLHSAGEQMSKASRLS